MARIRAVFFDAGNTLIFPRLDELAQELTSLGYPASVADFRASERAGKQKLTEWLTPQIASGSIPRAVDPIYWREYLTFLAERIAVPAPERERVMRLVGERFADILLWSEVAAGALPLLDELRAQGYRLGAVSNSNGMIEQQLARVGLGPRLDFVLDSHWVGVEKPHPEIFNLALERARVSAPEAVFVGDSYATDIYGARGAGLHPVLFDPTGVYDGSGGDRLNCPRITALADLQKLLNAMVL